MALRAQARTDPAVRAECLLAAWGRTEFEDDGDEIKAMTGALYVAELTHHVEQIVKLLSAPSK